MPLPLLLQLLLLPLLSVSWAGAVHVTTGSSRPCRLEQLPMRILTCSGDDVTTVPTVDAGLGVKILYMDACPLADIGPDSFANLTGSLTYLSVRTTVPIANLHGDAFRNLSLLVELRVVASGMQETAANPARLLATLTSLTFLHLENLKLGHLPSEFAAGTKVATMRLINAEIVSIAPDAFARLPSLSVLEFCKNPASTYVADLLRQVGSVEELTMTACSLTQVRATASFSRLRRINMANNQLTLLDLRTLAGLSDTLEELSLSSNKFSADGLPGLGLLTSLKRLYLTSNGLKQMPNNLGQLEGLELLDARLTAVTNIRVGDFHENSRLTSLTLDDAPISLVEVTAFQRLSHLAELSLTLPSSPILVRSVTDRQPATWPELLGQLSVLRNLSLSGFGPGALGGLDNSVWPGLAANQNLRRLVLDHNVITSVPDFQFAVARLDLLSLRGNIISSLNSASLYGLRPKAQVQLQDNGLRTLDNCSLAGFADLAAVGLSGNPWRCDCSLVWLLQRLRAESAASLAGITCDQPDSLRGRPWSDLSEDDFCTSGSSGAIVPPCEIRVPPNSAPPTPTAFPYVLDFQLSMEPGEEQLLVRLILNTSGLASRFDRYTVRFGPDSGFDLSSRFQEALISVHSLTFHLDSVEPHRFCVILQGPDANVESSKNCRTFLPTKAASQLTVGHISAAVVVPISALGIIGIIIFCLVSKRTRRKKAVQTAMARRAAEDYSYTYLDSENPNNAGNPRFQSARKPESRQFTKRSGGNTLGGSRPSLTASASNLQQQLQQMQQVQQMQQMQQMQAHRMHSLSQVGYQPDPFTSAGSAGGWDPRSMRASRSTDHLSMAASGPQGGPGRARSQEFGIDRPMLTRSRSGFGQYPQYPDEEVPPPLPARNPSRSIPHMEDPEAYEEMGS